MYSERKFKRVCTLVLILFVCLCHTPWLYRHRPAWDVTVLALMLGGTALSVTGIVIGWRRLRRKLGIPSKEEGHSSSEELAILI
jgi:hypothetical protein